MKKKETLVADDATLADPNLNPKEGWQSIKGDLSFPEVFTVFAPNDKLSKELGYDIPKFVESGQEKIKGKDYVFDKYVTTKKSLAGEDLGEVFYYLYYDKKGELSQIRTKFFADGKEDNSQKNCWRNTR